jgi:hypothetical protein
MRHRLLAALGVAALGLAAPQAAPAHFILEAPKSWLVENQLGDPQKSGPCGGTSKDAGTPTGDITELTGGSTLHIKVKETVYHPGHFRVALAVLDRAELPADPEDITKEGPRGPISVSGKIDPDPKPPVIVDGLWEHHERQPGREFETDIKVPNINCDHCTLQVIQFMEEHGVNPDGRFTYHHCADLKIKADPKQKLDLSWPGQAKGKAKGKKG